MSLSPAQLSERLEGITATEIAAIAGLHPYRKPIDVYLDKTGDGPAFEGNDRSRWGEILEEPIRDDYEQRHGVRVEQVGTLSRDGVPWQKATPDGIVYVIGAREPDRGLEIKVHSHSAVWHGQLEYGAPGTDEIPLHELAQCMWGMNVAGLPAWDLIAFLDGAPVEYTVYRDDELIEMLIEAGQRFRTDHLEARVPPPPDGSSAYTAWQKRKWKGKELRPDVLELTMDDPLRDTIMQLREVREQISTNERIRDRHVQTIKEVIGDKTSIKWHDERGKLSTINWKRNRDGQRIDWEAIATARKQRAAVTLSANMMNLRRAIVLAGEFAGDDAAVACAAAINDAISALADVASVGLETQHTKTTDGARPFTVPRHWSKNENDKPKHEQEG